MSINNALGHLNGNRNKTPVQTILFGFIHMFIDRLQQSSRERERTDPFLLTYILSHKALQSYLIYDISHQLTIHSTAHGVHVMYNPGTLAIVNKRRQRTKLLDDIRIFHFEYTKHLKWSKHILKKQRVNEVKTKPYNGTDALKECH